MSQYPWFDFDQVDFVTSDTHFSHARISELAERPFTSVEEMNAELVRRWNEAVGTDDTVLHLGDLALGPIEESVGLTAQLNGRRFLVPGNHDRISPATQSRRAIERFAPLYEAAGVEHPPRGHRGHPRRVQDPGIPLPLQRRLTRHRPAHDAPAARGRGCSAAARSHACP